MNISKRVIIKILCFSVLFNVISTDSSFGMGCCGIVKNAWGRVEKTVDDTTKTLGKEGVKTTEILGYLCTGIGILGGGCALICKGVLGDTGSEFTANAMGAAVVSVMSGIGFLALSKTLKWCFGKKPNYEKDRNRIDQERLDLQWEKFEWEKERESCESSSDEDSSDSFDDEE